MVYMRNQNMKEKTFPLKHALQQIIAACIAKSIVIQAGINMGFSTILLGQVMPANNTISNVSYSEAARNVTNDFTVDSDEASWIASLVTITTPVGSLLTGPLMDRFGRKAICAFSPMPFVFAWTLVTLSSNVYMIYVARVLAGIGGGLTTVTLVYVSEISHPDLRPMLLSFNSVVVAFGILIITVLGYFLHWRTIAICCGLMAVTSFVLIMFIPESPHWLVGVRPRKKDDDPNVGLKLAQQSLRWLYRRNEDYETEMESIMKIKERQDALKTGKLFEALEEDVNIRPAKTWKPIIILFVLFTLQQFSGGYVVIFYAVQIFEKVATVGLDQSKSVVILGFVRFLMSLLTVFLSKFIGRKKLLASSGLGMVVSISISALSLHIQGAGIVSVIGILLFVLFSSFGVLVIPWCLIGELLPLRIRGKGSGVMIAVAYVLMFVTIKSFIVLVEMTCLTAIFVSFAAFSFLLVVFVLLYVPETLGKTFEEIEDSL